MKEIIMKVLDDVADSQLNLSSEAARKTLANLITAALTTEDKVEEKVEWPGLDHVISRNEAIEQAYREITADGLPQGGDIEAMKLAEALVDDLKEGDYIYESPDSGKTVFRRKFQDYDSNRKEEIDWDTKEPTGRKFSQYNNGNWSDDEN
tara:strand:+ start:1373 stop:1822 length:450 start_codon:yes stop_codon:yes gene_type:complete